MGDTDESAAPAAGPVRLRQSLRLRLLEIAREAIFERVARGKLPDLKVTEPELLEPGAAFVTLTYEGTERGSMGTLYEEKPLWETVAEMAAAASDSDPRFGPLTQRELARLELEISVLTPFRFTAPEAVEVGVHGLYVAKGPKRGVLLPQVATQLGWDRERFLDEACRKAGLPAGAWREDDETLVLTFTAEVFGTRTVLDE